METDLVSRKKRITDDYVIKDNITLCQVYDFRITGKMSQAYKYRKQMLDMVKDGVDMRTASEELKRKYRAKAIQANVHDYFVEEEK